MACPYHGQLGYCNLLPRSSQKRSGSLRGKILPWPYGSRHVSWRDPATLLLVVSHFRFYFAVNFFLGAGNMEAVSGALLSNVLALKIVSIPDSSRIFKFLQC
jgi:hypothetical protein